MQIQISRSQNKTGKGKKVFSELASIKTVDEGKGAVEFFNSSVVQCAHW